MTDLNALHKGASAPLVNNTNFASQNIDLETGEVLESSIIYDRFFTVSDRYKLQRIAASFLVDSRPSNAKSYRVSKCVYTRISTDVNVVISTSGTASYKGVMYCGSVWTCPVCSAKISYHRKTELEKSLDTFQASGGFTYMLTLTVPHTREISLKDVLGESKGKRGILRAFNLLTTHRTFSDFRKYGSYLGMIRALEVTYGDNGWHPHLHIVLFSTALLPGDFKTKLFRAWKVSCVKALLKPPTLKRGVDLKRAFSPAEYVTKFGYDTHWGTASEITSGHSKTGRKSLTPFDFLRSPTPDKTRPYFQEYASAFFGKQQLSYTKGLKALLAVPDLDDMAIASGDHERATLCAQLSSDDWKKIIANDKQHNTRATVLKLAETGGVTAVINYLRSF